MVRSEGDKSDIVKSDHGLAAKQNEMKEIWMYVYDIDDMSN
jgi:hypothetical protein